MPLYLATELNSPLHLLDVEEVLDEDHVDIILDQHLERLGQFFLHQLLVPETKLLRQNVHFWVFSHFVVT